MKHVTRYFNVLIPKLAALQFTLGGPIIAVQVENEYGSTEALSFVPQKDYMREIRDLIVSNGIKELLLTSDSPTGHQDHGTLPGGKFGLILRTTFQRFGLLQRFCKQQILQRLPMINLMH